MGVIEQRGQIFFSDWSWVRKRQTDDLVDDLGETVLRHPEGRE